MGSCTSNRQDMPWSYVASKGVWIAGSLLHIGPYGVARRLAACLAIRITAATGPGARHFGWFGVVAGCR